jgi:hypothetical protein
MRTNLSRWDKTLGTNGTGSYDVIPRDRGGEEAAIT